MGEKKTISVKIDQKKVELQKKKKDFPNPETFSFHKGNVEQAATTDEARNEEVQPFARQYSDQFVHSKRKVNPSNFRKIRPLVFASISAVVIGSILGIILLNMFVNIDDITNPMNPTPVTSIDTDEREEQTNNNTGNDGENMSTKTLGTMDGFVLQGGVFSEETNATEVGRDFEEEGFQPVIWNRDNQYYLLVGLSNTQEHAKSNAESLMDLDLEVFVKDWNSGELEMELSEEEYKWFQSFQSQWDQSLASISTQDSIVLTDWNSIFENSPPNSNTVDQFLASIEPYTSKLQDASNQELQYILLGMWYELEALAH
ncbi:hypothetical protein GMD78_00960 [Ornithinibacillus sp. L9]|uniref:SPOR domain-containing protein n=1 Tax=Ornithinibacillus caprae TaxID=2678566 RepID=A0A6N8FCT0_9BACI|nr:hypothetical protein [Ornithinibacillus caprae]MUK86971.1 hypothetical protein [Ornithinibacillus caprae]